MTSDSFLAIQVRPSLTYVSKKESDFVSLRGMEAVTGFRFRESDKPDGLPLIDDGTELQLPGGLGADGLFAKSKED